MNRLLPIVMLTLPLTMLLQGTAAAAPMTVFTDTFNGGATNPTATTYGPGVTGGFSGITTTEAVPGTLFFVSPGWAFEGDYLRNTSVPAQKTTLILTGLGVHNTISLDFMLAIMDSWDGLNCCGPDYFNVTVGDGVTQLPIFHEIFDNVGAVGQTFHAPMERHDTSQFGNPGVNDSLYVMSGLSMFHNIAHTSNTLQIEFFASGVVWQGGADESWGIDEVKVFMDNIVASPVPEPATLSLLGIGLAGLARRFRRGATRPVAAVHTIAS